MWVVLFLVFNVIFCSIYYLITRKFDYWKKKKVPYIQPQFLFGNYKDYILMKVFIGDAAKKLCDQFPEEPYIGVFYGTEPTLLVRDPELLKLIMTKDFYYFHGREVSKYANSEAITKVIFFNSGDHWKVIRQNLTPLYSTAKMKAMFPLIEKCTQTFVKMLEYETSISNCLETNSIVSRFLMDCVGSCAFGIEINLMLNDHKDNPFRKLGTLILEDTDIRGYKNMMRAIWPKLFYALGLRSFPTEATDSLLELITNVVKLRNNKPSSRNDFVDLMLSLKNSEYLTGDSIRSMKSGSEPKKASVKFDDEVMAGQCAAFYAGAYETSSTTLTLTLFQLAKSKKHQSIVQKEIDEYFHKHQNKLDYDCVNELPYLTACMDETLRLHPVFSNLTREVMEDYTLPTGLHLEKGVRIHIPVYYIHRDPRNYPDPDEFQPERFLPENKENIKPFTYLPFGEGPRLCIGMRFAKMQVLAGLITVLKHYNLSLADGMSSDLVFSSKMFISRPSHDINLKFVPR